MADLGQPAVLRILFRALLVTGGLFALLFALLAWAIAGIDPCSVGEEGTCRLGGITGAAGSLVAVLAAAWLLFPAVATGVVAGYGDRVVLAIERRHYPAAEATPLGWAALLWLGLRSAARLLLFNLVALPGYLLLLVTGIGPVLLLVAVNGLALGRDLGELVAARHPSGGDTWLRASRRERLLLGLLVATLFLVPIANLFAPMLGAAVAVHLFHALPPRRAGE